MTKSPNTKHAFDLEERTLVFARDVIRFCKAVTPTPVTRDLISQVVRASGSVGANYREANDALSKKDFGNRIRITRREAKEAHYWLQLLEEAQPEANGDVTKLLREATELKKIFSAIVEKTS